MQCWQKQLFLFLFCGIINSGIHAQTKGDTIIKQQSQLKKLDTTKRTPIKYQSAIIKDSIVIDSLRQKDSILATQQTISNQTNNNNITNGFSFLQQASLLNNKPFINKIAITKTASNSKDGLFYILAFIVFILALIKVVFPKHLVNVFNIFFQTNYRQKQTKDHLLQDKLAHFGLMLVFYSSSSVFGASLLYNAALFTIGFWQLTILCFLLFLSIYSLKYIFITVLGILFKEIEASTTYIFLVFLINKLIGVLLIPVVILISFSTASIAKTSLTVSLILIGILLLYRVFLTYKSVSNRLNINIFQFFLYFCGIEILPLLLIYKASVLYWQ